MRIWDAQNRNINIKKHRNFTLFIVLMLIFSSTIFSVSVRSDNPSSCSNISFSINFEKPVLTEIEIENNTYTQVHISNCVSQGSIGDPCLPFFTSNILIPQGKQITNIEVLPGRSRIINCNLIDKPILPEQKSFPFCVQSDDSFIINDTKYNLSEPVFDEIYSIGEISYCRGFEILDIYLHPVFYIPKSGILRYFPKITININLEEKPGILNQISNPLLRLTDEDVDFVGSIIDNPEDIGSYTEPSAPLGGGGPLGYDNGLCDPSDSYDYVIITSQSLKDASGYTYNWYDLINHRQSFSGLSGTIVTVEEINSCTEYWNDSEIFNDSQAHIREFCKDAYQDWETQYVLLGGDWDSDASHQIVPYRLFEDRYETNPYDTMACDKYYSHLDGDWYYSSSGIWGGGKNSGVNDLYGELIIGRITAYTAEMVSNAINKIINYDTSTSLSDDWHSSAAFCGGDLGWSATSKQYMEEIRLGTDTYRTFTGFEEWNNGNPDNQIDTSVRLYHADLGSSYGTSFHNSIENDEFSMLTHISHSSWNTPFGLTNWQFRYNTKPFFGITQGCLAGRFHSGYSGCEQLICRHNERHAFGLVLNTGYGYGSPYSTNGASQYIQAFFWDYFFNNQSDNPGNWQIGKAMMYASDKMGSIVNSNPTYWCYSWYSAHFFGDPAQILVLNSDTNNAVQLSNENPSNETIDVSTGLSTLSITMQDSDDDVINWTIETKPDIGSSSGNNDNEGVKTCTVSNLEYSTTYNWYVNVSDGYVWTRERYEFTTESLPTNNKPTITNPSVSNSSTDVSLSTSQLSITIEDPEGDSITWTIETKPDIGSSSGNSENNGTKTCSLSVISYDTTYTWYVNATDGDSNTKKWYTFTTRDYYTPDQPSSFTAIANGREQIDLSWNNDNEADTTRIEWNTAQDLTWEVGDHDLLFNGTTETTSQTGLTPETTRYYKAWSWNQTDKVWSTGTSTSATTNANTAPTINTPNPNNGSTSQPLSLTFSISITDTDNDPFDWTIESSNGQTNNANSDSDGTKELSLSNLDYNTQYKIWINVTDSYDYNRKWYQFTTRDYYTPDQPSDFSATANGRNQIDLSWNNVIEADTTRVEWHTTQDPSWDVGDYNLLYNTTEETVSQTGLNPSTTRFYKSWSWNNTDKLWSNGATASATTDNNNAPSFGTPTPSNTSTDRTFSLTWSISITDADSDTFDWTIECSNGQTNSVNSDSDGTKQLTISGLDYNSVYYVWVNATDGYDYNRKWYTFTTRNYYIPEPPVSFTATTINRTKIDLSWTHNTNTDNIYIRYNTSTYPTDRNSGILLYNNTGTTISAINLNFETTYYFKAWAWNQTDNQWSVSTSTTTATTNENCAPIINTPNPNNDSTSQPLSQTFSISISDTDNDLFDWTIESSNGQTNNANQDADGTKQLTISGLNFNTEYYVWVNATDGYDYSRKWYKFTTRTENEPAVPGSFSATPNGRFQIDLTWDIGANSDYTFIEYKSIGGSWYRGEGTELYNNTGTSISHTSLSLGSTIYYQAWSWNTTDQCWSGSYAFDSATTEINSVPAFSNPSPNNKSSKISLSTSTISISINDPDGDFFNWSIETKPNIGSNYQNNDNNGTKTCNIEHDLEPLTTYYWYVNATDGNSTVNKTYWFKTKSSSSSNNKDNNNLPENSAPIADAGGPYSGKVNSTIFFDASKSSDSDGNIVSYSWDFGNGNIGNGVNVSYAYDDVGEYTVTLTVEDNRGSSSSDIANVTISKINQNESENIPPLGSDGDSNESEINDDDCDGIPNIIEEEFGTDSNNSSGVKNVNISNKTSYLVDTDGDGEVDKFYDPEDNVKTTIIKINKGRYLIDSDGDGDYEYIYDVTNNMCSSYSSKDGKRSNRNDSNIFWLILLMIGITLIGILVSYKERISLYFVNRKLSSLQRQNSNHGKHFNFKN